MVKLFWDKVTVQTVAGRSVKRTLRGALSLREKRNGTKFERSKTALSLSAGVFRGPLRVLFMLCPATVWTVT